ncbi:hypothetical protein ACFWC9_13470 [Streptomyces goshikiensis]|uniref:hypothetical protein n=1 Tax=Streptomyces goshikiensis TaxID=1942 RepID=UPI0036852899
MPVRRTRRPDRVGGLRGDRPLRPSPPRTERFLAETGYTDRVNVVLGDGTHGAPEPLVPAEGFDAIMVTVAAHDIPAAWRDQLAEGGRLVLPLRIGGFTRAVGLHKQADSLHSAGISACGFVPIPGDGRWDETPDPIGESGYGIRWEDTPPAPLDDLDRGLTAAGVGVRTGVTVAENESFEDLQLWVATDPWPAWWSSAVNTTSTPIHACGNSASRASAPTARPPPTRWPAPSRPGTETCAAAPPPH